MAYIRRERCATGAMRRWWRLKRAAKSEPSGSEAENVTCEFDSSNFGDPRSGGIHGILHCSCAPVDSQGRENASAVGKDLLLGDGCRGFDGDGAGDLASDFIFGVRCGVQFLLCISRISRAFA